MSRLRVLTVCTGNVCRSPAAAVLLLRGVDKAGLTDRIEIGSAGTSWASAGEPMDERIVTSLERAGYTKPFDHIARTAHQSEMANWDLVLPMTLEHAGVVRRQVEQLPADGPRPQVALWRQFDPAAAVDAREEDLGVADPWYSGQRAFDRTVLLMERSVPSLVMYLRGMLADREGQRPSSDFR